LVAQRGSLDVLAGATPYLRLFGLVAGCHYLARGAHAVSQNSVEPQFDQRKMASAQFYAHNLLSAVGGLSDAVMAGNELLEDIGVEALAS
jgi:butyryl-CoA dehydrogenase